MAVEGLKAQDIPLEVYQGVGVVVEGLLLEPERRRREIRPRWHWACRRGWPLASSNTVWTIIKKFSIIRLLVASVSGQVPRLFVPMPITKRGIGKKGKIILHLRWPVVADLARDAAIGDPQPERKGRVLGGNRDRCGTARRRRWAELFQPVSESPAQTTSTAVRAASKVGRSLVGGVEDFKGHHEDRAYCST